MTKRRIRIKDIAVEAGVSTGTVDRVIHKRGNVTPNVRKRVEQVMKDLNYQPNILASALASNKDFKIAALLPDFNKDDYWKSPYKGLESAVKANQHFSISIKYYLFDEKEPQTFVDQAFKLLGDLPDALVIAPIFAKEAQQFLITFSKKKIPFILINSNLSSDQRLSYIGQDSYQCGILGAKLLSTDKQELDTLLLLHLEEKEMGGNATHIDQKEAGFFEFFKQHKHSFNLLKKDFGAASDGTTIRQFLQNVLKECPNLKGIFVTTSKAYQLIDLLGEQLKDTTIIGFDLLPQNVNYLKTGAIDYLINQNPEKQGFLAVSRLIDHYLLKKEVKPVEYLPLDIVVKENVQYYL